MPGAFKPWWMDHDDDWVDTLDPTYIDGREYGTGGATDLVPPHASWHAGHVGFFLPNVQKFPGEVKDGWPIWCKDDDLTEVFDLDFAQAIQDAPNDEFLAGDTIGNWRMDAYDAAGVAIAVGEPIAFYDAPFDAAYFDSYYIKLEWLGPNDFLIDFSRPWHVRLEALVDNVLIGDSPTISSGMVLKATNTSVSHGPGEGGIELKRLGPSATPSIHTVEWVHGMPCTHPFRCREPASTSLPDFHQPLTDPDHHLVTPGGLPAMRVEGLCFVDAEMRIRICTDAKIEILTDKTTTVNNDVEIYYSDYPKPNPDPDGWISDDTFLFLRENATWNVEQPPYYTCENETFIPPYDLLQYYSPTQDITFSIGPETYVRRAKVGV